MGIIKLLSYFIITSIFYSFLVNAVGIGSIEKLYHEIDFQPGLERTFSYNVVPNSGATMDYEINAQEDLKEYVTFSQNFFPNLPPNNFPAFSATLKLPDNLEPGEHTAKVEVFSEGELISNDDMIVKVKNHKNDGLLSKKYTSLIIINTLLLLIAIYLVKYLTVYRK